MNAKEKQDLANQVSQNTALNMQYYNMQMMISFKQIESLCRIIESRDKYPEDIVKLAETALKQILVGNDETNKHTEDKV